ncbi:MAG TPA: lipid-A-disaccharide synthase [Candidatus Kapabacteria bacterium]|nr:lipid-A-disaccharide synthase [Candidatus Kapabacteria bacterium]
MQPAVPRKILLIAGERSGDRLAARVISEAKKIAAGKNISVKFFGVAGDGCRSQGMECFHDIREMSVVGFLEVAKRYGFFRRVFTQMTALLDDPHTKPDAVILVDYPGFNIRFAAQAKRRGIEVIYYVSPQVWAWKPSRVKKIVASVSRMLVIFPFEVDIYKHAGLLQTEFVGHPLVEILADERAKFVTRETFAAKFGLDVSKEWLLLFPGSRNEEVRRHIHVMTDAAKLLVAKLNVQPIIVESSTVNNELYVTGGNDVICFRSETDIHELMYHSQLGILKSGTTTLEAALSELPGVICYRTSWPTYWMARMLVKLKFIGLANIVLGKKLYPELLQSEMTAENIADAIVDVNSKRDVFKNELHEINVHLESHDASSSRRVAAYLFR